MMGNEGYREEFEEDNSLDEFQLWLSTYLDVFIQNIRNLKVSGEKPLHEWIDLFLQWSEYNDYVNSNKNGYKEIEMNTASEENPGPSPILRYFEYKHLPVHLQDISKNFYDLAHWIEAELPRGPEKTVALRKLLEAKDAAVRTKV